MELNKIYNMDCFELLNKLDKNNMVDVILTSPPYNTSKKRGTWSKEQKFHYDIKTVDSMDDENYMDFNTKLFNDFDRVLKKDGCVLYNMSYSTDKPYLMYQVINEIIKNTNFVIADTIVWKKKFALPNNMSHNRITRICEFVFVFCREKELKTFKMNKEVLSIRPNGIKQYTNYYNFIEAKNNDVSCKLNKATFSSDLVEKLLHMYAKEKAIVLDPFMGTGTTAIGCLKSNCNYIGSELSQAQCEYSKERINAYIKENNNM